MSTSDPYHVPARLRARFDEIVARTEAVATGHLDPEYAALCRRMAAALARRRPSPLERGEARTWAAAILYAVGWVNFLTDPTQTPHMTTAELAAASGVAQSTIAVAFRTVRDLLDLVPLDPEWTRPSKMLDNPVVWIALVDGLPVDLREAPREIQQAAFDDGLIPFVPEPRALDSSRDAEILAITGEDNPESLPPSIAATLQQAMRDGERVVQRTLDANPNATVEDLNAALEAATTDYNRRPQAELGGLSPVAVHRLLDADWYGAQSAIRLDESLPLEAIEASRTLYHARLLLAMLAERGGVKATPKGNLPRAFVGEFRDRIRQPVLEWDDARTEPTVRNEEDLFPLHLTRVLLEVAGLVKRRRGIFSPTRRGEQLTAASRAGELFATLVRTHFRRLNLAYLDRAGPAPEFQRAIGYALYQFARVGDEWRNADELSEALVLGSVHDEMPASPYFDLPTLVLETRFLRPLVGFGLAEQRHMNREPGELLARFAYRKTSLVDRVVRFRLGPDPEDID